MKKALSILVVGLLISVLVGCAEERERKKISVRQERADQVQTGTGIDPNTTSIANGHSQWGLITGFTMTALRNLIGASKDMNLLGNVDPTGAGSGFVFAGNIGVNINSITSSVSVPANSEILFVIYDDKAVAKTDSPFAIGGFAPEKLTGTITRTHATLVFGDSYGTITLDGDIQGDTSTSLYQGNISFTNSQCYNGQACGAGTSQSLGTFKVYTCGFFLCQ